MTRTFILLTLLASTAHSQSGTESERINRIVGDLQKQVAANTKAIQDITAEITPHWKFTNDHIFYAQNTEPSIWFPGEFQTSQSKVQAPTLTLDKTLPHTFTVRCEDGVYGIVINNELRSVEVTCWEPKKEK